MSSTLSVAVVTEWHPYDVVNFQRMLWSLPGIECYVQPLELYVQDPARDQYDAAVYYNMSGPDARAMDDHRYRYFSEELGRSGKGIVLLHHGILSYRNWPLWDEVSGVARRFSYHQDEHPRYRSVDPGHPVTEGLPEKFGLVDETYEMAEPGPDNHILIETDHPKSLRAIAWTREFRNSRVFCYQSGHDNRSWSDPNFQTVLRNGIFWSASKP